MASDLFRTAFNGFNRTDVVQFIQKQIKMHYILKLPMKQFVLVLQIQKKVI